MLFYISLGNQNFLSVDHVFVGVANLAYRYEKNTKMLDILRPC